MAPKEVDTVKIRTYSLMLFGKRR